MTGEITFLKAGKGWANPILHEHAFILSHIKWMSSKYRIISSFFILFLCAESCSRLSPLHFGSEEPRFWMSVLGHSLVHLLFCCSLICLFYTACFICLLRCIHLFPWSFTHFLPSLWENEWHLAVLKHSSKWMIRCPSIRLLWTIVKSEWLDVPGSGCSKP